eukprot:486928-Prorocentrum_minimum.AAC.1
MVSAISQMYIPGVYTASPAENTIPRLRIRPYPPQCSARIPPHCTQHAHARPKGNQGESEMSISSKRSAQHSPRSDAHRYPSKSSRVHPSAAAREAAANVRAKIGHLSTRPTGMPHIRLALLV